MIYVVTTGKYEENRNEFVTDDYEKALTFILSTKDRIGQFNEFSYLEFWDSGIETHCFYNRLDNWGTKALTREITFEELEQVIKKHICNLQESDEEE